MQKFRVETSPPADFTPFSGSMPRPLQPSRNPFSPSPVRAHWSKAKNLSKPWLAGKDHWLLVIDNADDPNMGISKLFPPGNRGAVLTTIHSPDFQQYGSARTSKADELCDEDAVMLLLIAAAAQINQDPGPVSRP